MKKKFLIGLITIILISITTTAVHANLIYREYNNDEKLEIFSEYVGGTSVKVFITLTLTLFIVLGFVLLTLNIVNKKGNKRFKSIVQNIFVGIGITLNILSIYFLKLIYLFPITYNKLHINNKIEDTKDFISLIYILYFILIDIFGIISIMKKKFKIFNLAIICITIILILINILELNNIKDISMGYITTSTF